MVKLYKSSKYLGVPIALMQKLKITFLICSYFFYFNLTW